MNLNNYLFALVLALTSVFSSPVIAEDGAGIRLEFTGDTLSAYPNTQPIWTSKIPQDIDITCLSSAVRKQSRTFTCNSTKPEQEKFSLKLSWIPVSGEITRVQYQITINPAGPTIVEQAKKERVKSSTVGDMALLTFCFPALMLLWLGFFSAKEGKSRMALIGLHVTILIGVVAIFATETTVGVALSVPLAVIVIIIGGAFGGLLGLAACLSTTFFVYLFSDTGNSDGLFMILGYLKFLLTVCLASFVLRELVTLFLDRNLWTKKLQKFYLEYRKQ